MRSFTVLAFAIILAVGLLAARPAPCLNGCGPARCVVDTHCLEGCECVVGTCLRAAGPHGESHDG